MAGQTCHLTQSPYSDTGPPVPAPTLHRQTPGRETTAEPVLLSLGGLHLCRQTAGKHCRTSSSFTGRTPPVSPDSRETTAEPVLLSLGGLHLYRQTAGKPLQDQFFFHWEDSVWKEIHAARGIEPRSAALETDALTSAPTSAMGRTP